MFRSSCTPSTSLTLRHLPRGWSRRRCPTCTRRSRRRLVRERPSARRRNKRVLEVLEEVGTPQSAEAWVRQALVQKRRIMGFGHRVYKRRSAGRHPPKLLHRPGPRGGRHEPRADRRHDRRQSSAKKKGCRRISTGPARLYKYLGLEVDLYTPLFVASRVVGWAATTHRTVRKQSTDPPAEQVHRPRAAKIRPARRAQVSPLR